MELSSWRWQSASRIGKMFVKPHMSDRMSIKRHLNHLIWIEFDNLQLVLSSISLLKKNSTLLKIYCSKNVHNILFISDKKYRLFNLLVISGHFQGNFAPCSYVKIEIMMIMHVEMCFFCLNAGVELISKDNLDSGSCQQVLRQWMIFGILSNGLWLDN
jgi:hypothetical protein